MLRTRKAQLVFAIHGVEKAFNGSLICVPFMEIEDDDEGQPRYTLIPVSEDGFVFFFNEDKDKLLARFGPWRDAVMKVALQELRRNL